MKIHSALTPIVFFAGIASLVNAQPLQGGLFGPGFGVGRNRPAADAPAAPVPDQGVAGLTRTIKRWNQIAVDASGLDHTPVSEGETRIYGEQLGPCRASRAMAIVHIAMADALNSIQPAFGSYSTLPRAPQGSLVNVAIAKAARDTLTEMFPSQQSRFDAFLAEDLATVPNSLARTNGLRAGAVAAQAILQARADDNSDIAEPLYGTEYIPQQGIMKWKQDPISQSGIALGAYWSLVKPFVMTSADAFRCPQPPDVDSVDHAMSFVEVKRLGGDGETTATERTEEEAFIGTYWAYDGTPSLCAPPRLYNQIAITIATQEGTTGTNLMRLLASINVAMADTAIAAWESKYYYSVARPITALREADSDGNEDTLGNSSWTPLGAPASNLTGPNFTPPFPAYPSGHAAFGGALFETLRQFYGRDNIAFTFTSDEFNGETTDNDGNTRPLMPRSFENLSDAEYENAMSRIYLGIHWNYDATGGIEQGRKVGNLIVSQHFRPLTPPRR